MGCNAIRTSHNPPDPDFLDLCDRMGFCVMDEMYDEWQIPKRQNYQGCSVFYDEWHVRDTTDFVRRDRNHPCVVIWSAGNEIGEQTSPGGADVLQGLVDIFHKEDPTRPVTCACDNAYAEPRSATPEFMRLQDVAGYNYADRWRERANLYYSIDRREYPERKFIGTEDGSMGGIRGEYGNPFPPAEVPAAPAPAPAAGAPAQPPGAELFLSSWRTSMPKINVEQLWRFVRTNDYVAGDFMWTGIDYLGEGGVGSPAGVLDTCGFRKDGYYFYQSQWTSKPMVHLLPHWNWPGREGEVVPVVAYSNCAAVELFLNGRSLGVKAREFPSEGVSGIWNHFDQPKIEATTGDLQFVWDVVYQPGELKAVGYDRLGAVVSSEVVRTADKPARLEVSADRSAIISGSRDVAFVTVRALDANGVFVPLADNEVTFEVSGPAKLIGVDNGDPESHESYQSTSRTLFKGMALALLQSTSDPGTIHVTAHATGLADSTAELTSASVSVGDPAAKAP